MIFQLRSQEHDLTFAAKRETSCSVFGLESRNWDARRFEATSSMQSVTGDSQKLFGSEDMLLWAWEWLRTDADSRSGETDQWARRVPPPPRFGAALLRIV